MKNLIEWALIFLAPPLFTFIVYKSETLDRIIDYLLEAL